MAVKPLIAVTGAGHRMAYAWWATSFILRILGARPVHLTPNRAGLASDFDGIIIGGGEDIDPMLYGENRAEFANTDAARDIFEVGMIRQAIAARIPMLGICRGSQLINVVKGGTLHLTIRHWRKRTSNRSTPFPRKTAVIENQSKLASWLGCASCQINSLHHQAVHQLGESLQIAAHDLDGFVQAIESTNEHFIIGTQWHPEYLPYLSTQRNIFIALLNAAKDYQAARHRGTVRNDQSERQYRADIANQTEGQNTSYPMQNTQQNIDKAASICSADRK